MPTHNLSSQFSLKQNWTSICNTKVELDFPKVQWIYEWSCNDSSAGRIYNAVSMLKPKVIIETGTFAALGTYTMAKAAHDSNNEAHIFTIDYDGDPTTQLDRNDWLQLKEIRNSNLDLIRSKFPKVRIDFIEGDSRQVLPELFSDKVNSWDFFYQDSMHYKEGIMSEWEIMSKFSKVGSIVVFDDVALPIRAKSLIKRLLGRHSQFTEDFFWNEVIRGGWTCESIEDNHPQFWAQKIKTN